MNVVFYFFNIYRVVFHYMSVYHHIQSDKSENFIIYIFLWFNFVNSLSYSITFLKVINEYFL